MRFILCTLVFSLHESCTVHFSRPCLWGYASVWEDTNIFEERQSRVGRMTTLSSMHAGQKCHSSDAVSLPVRHAKRQFIRKPLLPALTPTSTSGTLSVWAPLDALKTHHHCCSEPDGDHKPVKGDPIYPKVAVIFLTLFLRAFSFIADSLK